MDNKGGPTRLMRQYLELKDQYKDCILMFRLGDFYEMFFDDAITASRELEIVLTGRDCGLPERAPMCGVPHHSVDGYINKLIDRGYKVALCEQLTDPKQSSGLVERGVVRVITPGTVIEETMLNDKANNYIAAINFESDKKAGIAYADVSTGEFYVVDDISSDAIGSIYNYLAMLMPREIIVNESAVEALSSLRASYYTAAYPDTAFKQKRALQVLLKHFKVSSLFGFGIEKHDSLSVCAAGALLSYLEETQKNSLSHIVSLKRHIQNEFMILDASTRMNLELTRPLRYDGNKRSTLLSLFDRTKTAMGGRLIRSWLEQPLINRRRIERRLDCVEELFDKRIVCDDLSSVLSGIYDIGRLCSKIAYGSIMPKDCIALKLSVAKLPQIFGIIDTLQSESYVGLSTDFDMLDDIFELLHLSIDDNPPVSIKDGGFIKAGYNEEIDKYRSASVNAKDWINQLEAAERESTGIKNLKIKYNRVFGYYIEVTKSYQQLVPYNYIRKQTLANAERYTTQELKELEATILGADEKCIELEHRLFAEIREILYACIPRLQNVAGIIAELDAYQCLAQLAIAEDYCRPRINEEGIIDISDGRHPVVEHTDKKSFVPNSTYMDMNGNRLLIITGPNMAGKSTYMRQVALICLMAHIGSFIPASSANISIIDRIFTRVGASDNLSSGQSTFMIEMTEVANILNNATNRSLLILDEIGRGTSTFDGLSIAWAVLEHISLKSCAKALFATHYHELTGLEGSLDGVKNYRVAIKEFGDNIIFLHRIVPGKAEKSFGVQVAKLAGLPKCVIERSQRILHELEESDISQKHRNVSMTSEFSQPDKESEIVEKLRGINVNELTPLEAMLTLSELITMARSEV